MIPGFDQQVAGFVIPVEIDEGRDVDFYRGSVPRENFPGFPRADQSVLEAVFLLEKNAALDQKPIRFGAVSEGEIKRLMGQFEVTKVALARANQTEEIAKIG